MDETPPRIDSFVIRFIHLPSSEKPEALRGSVRHVQSNREKGFTNWDEAEAFIRGYVPAIRTGDPDR